MNKEEAIKEAYGENWIFYKDHVNENGWIKDREFWGKWPKSLTEIIWQTTDHDNDYYDTRRPKSLQGIEDNNGWVKIESEDDLPKERGVFFINDIRGFESICQYNMHFKTFCRIGTMICFDDVTHYQPIQKPKRPIY